MKCFVFCLVRVFGCVVPAKTSQTNSIKKIKKTIMGAHVHSPSGLYMKCELFELTKKMNKKINRG